MRKFLLLPALAALALFANAQVPAQPEQNHRNEKELTTRAVHPIVTLPVRNYSVKEKAPHHTGTLKNLSTGVRLNEQRVGSAGNLLTILNYNCNQLDVNPAVNSVTFVHRVDPTVQPTSNVAQYDYDLSQDGGTTWLNNIGPITNSVIIDNIHVNGRYPQGGIFNPPGNTTKDSAYLVYSGTWHNDPGTNVGEWVGQMRGRGYLNSAGDASTFNVHIDTVTPTAITAVASSFCQSQPGVFWNLNEDYTGTFVTGSNAFTKGIIVQKGVWNQVTRDVDWTNHEITQQFDSVLDATTNTIFSVASSFSIAFDPSGQFGWISCIGDITSNPSSDSVYHAIFWKSVDSGATWTGPMQVITDSLPGVVNQTASYIGGLIAGANTGVMFQANLTVDYQGNPHMFCSVGYGSGYSNYYPNTEFTAYDITFNPAPGPCDSTWNGWQAVFVDSIQTFQGTYTTDNPAYTEDNRPLVSRSPDGTKLFFYWLDSDLGFEGSDVNNNPNLFTRGFDVAHHTSTPPINVTLNDTLFGGQTLLSVQNGIFNGANFPTVAPIALQNGTSYTVPLILTQVDYQNTNGGLGLGANPAAFWYVSNLTYSASDFSISNTLSATITVTGQDTIVVPLGQNYSDQGATITTNSTCFNPGALHLVTDSSAVNTGVPGTYIVYYTAEDGSGNVYASATRTVIVQSPPIADFSWLPVGDIGRLLQFTDASTYSPTSWAWTFGDPGSSSNASTQQNPQHDFTGFGNYNVCLIASNASGASQQVCHQVNVVSGINDINFSQHISMFPNPTSGKVNITIEGIAPDFSVSVYNVLGEEVNGTSYYKAGTTNVEMDMTSLASGVYMVKIQSSNYGSSIKRLTVTHK